MTVTSSTPTTNGHFHHVPSRLCFLDEPPSLSTFKNLCSQIIDSTLYPLATSISSNIPVYDLSTISPITSKEITALQNEWHHILASGPGVLVLQSFLPDTTLIYHINTIFTSIIASEVSTSKGDHFAPKPGTNSRIWNSLQKHALGDPASFVAYYSNPWLPLIAEAWLGPYSRTTAQLNIVHPGGAPQVAHRDYHLGFQTAEQCARFPRATQVASQYLTLQGAIAHSDMPLESGTTRFLPFSQMFEDGFMAYRLPKFQAYFDENWVSLPLMTGDAVFFNPALFHAAGENRTRNMHRSANLLQISSAFGKPMETIDTLGMIGRCWDELGKLYEKEGRVSPRVQAAVDAVAEGYPFPTNLDARPPLPGGMAPESEAELVIRGLIGGWGVSDIVKEIRNMSGE